MTLSFRWLASPFLMIAPSPKHLMIDEIVCSRACGEDAGIDWFEYTIAAPAFPTWVPTGSESGQQLRLPTVGSSVHMFECVKAESWAWEKGWG